MNLNNLNGNDLSKAVALFFDGESAPTLSAKGEGLAAEEIIRIAEECGVPLCDNPALVELLATLDIGDSIPEALYICVATIISFAYQLKGKRPNDYN